MASQTRDSAAAFAVTRIVGHGVRGLERAHRRWRAAALREQAPEPDENRRGIARGPAPSQRAGQLAQRAFGRGMTSSHGKRIGARGKRGDVERARRRSA